MCESYFHRLFMRLMVDRAVQCFEIVAHDLVARRRPAAQAPLLEKTLTALRARNASCAVIEGDQATDLDAKRIARAGVSVFQIETGRACHLDALQVQRALGHIDVPDHGLLFIEKFGISSAPPSSNSASTNALRS